LHRTTSYERNFRRMCRYLPQIVSPKEPKNGSSTTQRLPILPRGFTGFYWSSRAAPVQSLFPLIDISPISAASLASISDDRTLRYFSFTRQSHDSEEEMTDKATQNRMLREQHPKYSNCHLDVSTSLPVLISTPNASYIHVLFHKRDPKSALSRWKKPCE
jgi:hypothetical protein